MSNGVRDLHSQPLSLSVTTIITSSPRFVNKAKLAGLIFVFFCNSNYTIDEAPFFYHYKCAALPVLGEEKCLIVTIFATVWSVYTYEDLKDDS